MHGEVHCVRLAIARNTAEFVATLAKFQRRSRCKRNRFLIQKPRCFPVTSNLHRHSGKTADPQKLCAITG